MLLEFIVFTITFLGICIFYKSNKKPKEYPPGPYSWPILGNLPQIGFEPYKTVMTMRQKYGDIIGIDLGGSRSVWITEYNILKEAYNIPALCGRAAMPLYADQKTGIVGGIVFNSSASAMEQRKFAFAYIQSGFRNGTPMETLVMEEVTDVIEQLNKTCGQSISTKLTFNIALVNTLWIILTGKKYSLNDPDFNSVIMHNSSLLSSLLFQGILFYPKFAEKFPKLSGYQKLLRHITPIRKFMQDIVDDHKNTYEEGIQRDFIDAYLQKIKNTKDPNSSFYGVSGEVHLVSLLHDFFMAGTETPALTITWTVFLVAHHPDVQEKLINSIHSYAKERQLVTLKDKSNLPYVEAVIREAERFSSIAPLGLFHSALEDVEFKGYKIPKGTLIAANHYGIHKDPAVWGDPENFRPERFLTDDGTELVRRGELTSFGVGRRICPGEFFARDEIFLFVSSLFQNFRVEFDPSLPIPPPKHIVGHVLHPVEHRLIFRKQFE